MPLKMAVIGDRDRGGAGCSRWSRGRCWGGDGTLRPKPAASPLPLKMLTAGKRQRPAPPGCGGLGSAGRCAAPGLAGGGGEETVNYPLQ